MSAVAETVSFVHGSGMIDVGAMVDWLREGLQSLVPVNSPPPWISAVPRISLPIRRQLCCRLGCRHGMLLFASSHGCKAVQ